METQDRRRATNTMTRDTSLVFLLLLIAITSGVTCTQNDVRYNWSEASAAGDEFPEWPDFCCPLHLQEHQFEHMVPEDIVFAGDVDGLRYGYAVNRHGDYYVRSVPESFQVLPVYLGTDFNCDSDTKVNLFEVLTNPDKCAVQWYTTRYEEERFFNDSGVTMNQTEVYLPAYHGQYFAWRVYPGVSELGTSFFCQDAEHIRVTNTASGTNILAVNCRESLVTMSDTKLFNISIADANLDSVTGPEDVHLKRTFINTSNETQRQSFSFSSQITNSLLVKISESFSSSNCETQKKSFSTTFRQTDSFDVGTAGIIEALIGVSAKIHTEVTSGFDKLFEQTSTACTSYSKNTTTRSVHKEVKRYAFGDVIIIPPRTRVNVTAISTRSKGRIPYVMTYALTPHANAANSHLYRGLEYFKFGDRIDKMENGTVLVHFDGEMIVDSGYEILVDVIATPIDSEGETKSQNSSLMSRQSVFPSSG